jgi:hypothetical protein
MKNYLNLLKILKKNTHSGYTLIELIIASVLTVMVVSAAGMGVVLMTQKNMIASADGDIKYNLGRAVDFMTEEIKTASIIRDSISSIDAGTFDSTGKTIVLAIKVPGVDDDIIYYTQAPDSGSPWLGNLAIYRWGPGLDQDDGTYTGTWGSNLLVDLIANAPGTPITDTTPNVPESGKNTGCADNSAVINTTGATTGWTQIPSTNQKGFYVCVNNTTGTSGNRKIVEIHASASAQNNRVSNPLSWGSGSGGGYAASGEPTYEIITQAYARAN